MEILRHLYSAAWRDGGEVGNRRKMGANWAHYCVPGPGLLHTPHGPRAAAILLAAPPLRECINMRVLSSSHLPAAFCVGLASYLLDWCPLCDFVFLIISPLSSV